MSNNIVLYHLRKPKKNRYYCSKCGYYHARPKNFIKLGYWKRINKVYVRHLRFKTPKNPDIENMFLYVNWGEWGYDAGKSFKCGVCGTRVEKPTDFVTVQYQGENYGLAWTKNYCFDCTTKIPRIIIWTSSNDKIKKQEVLNADSSHA